MTSNTLTYYLTVGRKMDIVVDGANEKTEKETNLLTQIDFLSLV